MEQGVWWTCSLEQRVFLSCFAQRLQIRVSPLPTGKKILVGLARRHEVAGQGGRTGEPETRQWIEHGIHAVTAMVQDALEVRNRLGAVLQLEVRAPSQVGGPVEGHDGV